MSKVSSYVNNMFCSLPKTKQVVEVKLGMIENMEEKYQALLDDGKSENEAFGIVAADFGSMEELCEEMGWNFDTAEGAAVAAAPEPAPEPVFSPELLTEYAAFRKKFIRVMALGIALLSIGTGVLILYVDARPYLSADWLWIFGFASVISGYLLVSYKKRDIEYWRRLRGKDASSPYLPYLWRTDKDAETENICAIVALAVLSLSVIMCLIRGLEHMPFVFALIGILICCVVVIVRAGGRKMVIKECLECQKLQQ